MASKDTTDSKPKLVYVSAVEGPLSVHIIAYAVTFSIGFISVLGASLLDFYLISKLGSDSTEAVSLIFPVLAIIGSACLGFGVGAATSVARMLGSAQLDTTQRFAVHLALLSVLLGVALAVLCSFVITPLIVYEATSVSAADHVRNYLYVYSFSVVFLSIQLLGNSVLRAAGATYPSMISILVYSVLYVALNPFMVFGLGSWQGWGMEGAAYTQLISRGLGSIYTVWSLWRMGYLSLPSIDMKYLTADWREALRYGVPATLSQLAGPLGSLLVLAIIIQYGPSATVAMGINGRLDMFFMSITLPLSSCVIPLMAQNLGAGKIDRARDVVRLSIIYGMSLNAVMAVVVVLGSESFTRLFSNDPRVISIVSLYAFLTVPSFAFQVLLQIIIASQTGAGHPRRALLLNLIWTGSLVSASWLASQTLGIAGVFGAIATVNFICACSFSIYYLWWSTKRNLGQNRLTYIASHPKKT